MNKQSRNSKINVTRKHKKIDLNFLKSKTKRLLTVITLLVLVAALIYFSENYKIKIIIADDPDELIESINANPSNYLDKEVMIRGNLIDLPPQPNYEPHEWARLSSCQHIYVKKAVPSQAFEFEKTYSVKGHIQYENTPFAGNIYYIETDSTINKSN